MLYLDSVSAAVRAELAKDFKNTFHQSQCNVRKSASAKLCCFSAWVLLLVRAKKHSDFSSGFWV